MRVLALTLAILGAVWHGAAIAQENAPQSIPFEGGAISITETEDLDKIVAFDGQELARNYVAFYDRTVEVGGINVALLSVGDGGNQCGPATLIVWKKDGEVSSVMVGEYACGSPPPAAGEYAIYFVPYLVPGASGTVLQLWTPDAGLRVAGAIAFAPQPETIWADLDADDLSNIVEVFDNAEVYKQARGMLGDRITGFATGLLTGGGTESLPSGIFYSSGCVPHACGIQDSFAAVDPAAKKLYFAQQTDGDQPNAWPTLSEWPKDVHDAMQTAIGKQ